MFRMRPPWVAFLPLLLVALGQAASADDRGGKIPITTSSEEARALFLQGRDLVEKLRGTDARPLLEQAVGKDPGFAMAYFLLANTAPTNKGFFVELEQAVTHADKASEGERLQILAQQAGVKSEPEVQRQRLEKLVELFPNDERAHAALGIFWFARQDYQNAVKSLQRATEIAPDFSVPYNQLGYAFRFEEKYDEAEKAFKKYVELLPSDPNPHDSYAELLMKMGRFGESIASYRKALEADPHFIASYIGIAFNEVLSGHAQDARKTLRQLSSKARTDGERRQALFWTAMSFVHEGRFGDALTSVDKMSAISQKGGDLGAIAGDLNLAGNILLAAGKADQAACKFGESVQVNGRAKVPAEVQEAARRNSLFNLALVDIERKDPKAADTKLAEYRAKVEAKKVPFEMWQSHELAGRIALAKKDYQTAVDELGKANAQDPRVTYLKALALQGKGDQSAALAMARRAAEYNSINNINYAYVRKDARRFLEKARADKPDSPRSAEKGG